MDLQRAANFVGDECKKLMDGYFEERRNTRSWGRELDADLERYFDVLGQWVIANMEWSFETKRKLSKKCGGRALSGCSHSTIPSVLLLAAVVYFGLHAFAVLIHTLNSL